MMKNLLYLAVILFVITVKAQTSCDRLFDAIEFGDGLILSSEIPGSNIPSNPDIPVITKVDLSGNEIWRIEDDIDSFYNLRYIDLYNFNDGFLYANLTILDSHQNSSPNNRIWKIDAVNGNIIWETPLYQTDRESSGRVLDYDDNNLLFYFGKRDNYGDTIDGFEVFLFDKLTGTEQFVYENVRKLPYIRMVKDSNGNIIHSFLKRESNSSSDYVTSLRKINGLNFNNIIWENVYLPTGSGSATLNEVDLLYMSKLDEIYAFSTEQTIDLFKINSSDGTEEWSLNNLGGSQFISDIKLRNNAMYFSLSHSFVGSVFTSFDITKINLETAALEWTSSGLHMTVVGQPTSSSGSNEAVTSFDIDCNGDIYATGYYGSSNYAPGAWGIMKIDGTNGSKINDLTITNDTSFIDEESVGIRTFLINDTPYFLGNLQDQPNSSTRAFVETDTSLNSVINLVDLCNTLSVEQYSVDKNDMKFYPNPTSEQLFFEYKATINSIQLFDINGKEVYSSSEHKTSIDVSTLQSGVYFLKIKGEKGVISKKVIVE